MPIRGTHPATRPRPVTLLLALCAACCTAAAVALTWWLGVWGTLATFVARLKALEAAQLGTDAAIDGLRNRFQGMAGKRGHEVQQANRDRQRALQEEAERELLDRARKGAPPARLAAAPDPKADVLPGADRAFASVDGA